MHGIDGLQMLGIGQPAAQQLRVTADDHQQVVEVVGDAAGELAEGLHLLRLGELFLRPLERGLGLPPLGHVAGDVYEPGERADLVAHRLDHGARPEQALVAAHAPTLDDAFALVAGEMERACRLAALLLLLGVEAAEVLSDNFGRGILMDSLRAHVPIGDGAAAVEHEDRVVRDALNDGAKPPFALHQRLLRLAALGDVVLERGFDPLALIDLDAQGLARVGKPRAAFTERVPQVVVRALEVFRGAAAVGHVLRHEHEMVHGAARIGDDREVVAHPAARAVGEHVPRLERKPLGGVKRMPHRIGELRQVGGVDHILDAQLQQFRRRTANHPAKSIVGQSEAPCGIDLRDADARLAEHRAEDVLLVAQFYFHALAPGDVRAERETDHRDGDHERGQQQERLIRCGWRKRPAARQRSPSRKARQNEHAGRGVALSTGQRGPQQRQRHQECERAPERAMLEQRTEGDQPHERRRDNADAGGQHLVRVEGAKAADGPQHDGRRDDERARRIAQPAHGTRGEQALHLGICRKVEAPGVDERADQRAWSEHDQRKFEDARRRIEGSAALGRDVDQVAANERLERAPHLRTRGGQDRVRRACIGKARR